MPKTYINFNRRESLTMTSGTITRAKNLGKGGDDFSDNTGAGSTVCLYPTLNFLLNGVSVANFIKGASRATTSVLGQPTTNGLTPADPTYTIIVVQRCLIGGTAQRVLQGSKDENYLFGFYGFSNAMHQWYSGTFNVASPPTLVRGPFQLSTFRSTPTTYQPNVRGNGAQLNGANTVGAAPIGFGINTDSFFEGSDCELFAFAAWYGYLSDADTYKVEGAFAWEAGLQDVLLAANHPYRNRPPLIGD